MVLYMRLWLQVDLLEDPDVYLFRHRLFTHQELVEPYRESNNTMYDFVYNRARKALDELGLPQYGLHSLRKGRSIELRLAGGLEAVIERTCHSQNSLTAIRTYANVQNAVIGQRAIGQVVSPLGQTPATMPAPTTPEIWDLAEMPLLTTDDADAFADMWGFDSMTLDLPLIHSVAGTEMALAQLDAATIFGPATPSDGWRPIKKSGGPPPPPPLLSPPPPKKQKMSTEVRRG
jgi:hypothetical protein